MLQFMHQSYGQFCSVPSPRCGGMACPYTHICIVFVYTASFANAHFLVSIPVEKVSHTWWLFWKPSCSELLFFQAQILWEASVFHSRGGFPWFLDPSVLRKPRFKRRCFEGSNAVSAFRFVNAWIIIISCFQFAYGASPAFFLFLFIYMLNYLIYFVVYTDDVSE